MPLNLAPLTVSRVGSLTLLHAHVVTSLNIKVASDNNMGESSKFPKS